MIGTFRKGEDIAVALDIVSGAAASVASITAKMQRSTSGTGFAPDPRSAAITLTVTARAASGGIPAGWNLTLPASASINLRPGVYGIDARLVGTGGEIELTDETALIRLTEAVI